MGDVTKISEDIEIIETNRKATDYLEQLLNELIDRTGGESVANSRFVRVQVQVPDGSSTIIYTVPDDVSYAVIRQAVGTETSGANQTISISLSKENETTLADKAVYSGYGINANDVDILDALIGLPLETGEVISVFQSQRINYNFSIEEFVQGGF